MPSSYEAVAHYTPDPGCLIEIGSERGGGSTAYLNDYALHHGLTFYTVDIDAEVYDGIRHNYGDAAIHSRGLDFLHLVQQPISVAYLDGFDWIYDPNSDITAIQIPQYRYMGLELTNDNCQKEHLLEAEVVEQKSADRSLVIFDDTYLIEDGIFTGKGGTAAAFLLDHGYEHVLESSPGGAVFYREKK